MILRTILVPLLAAYGLFVAMAIWTLRAPVAERREHGERAGPGWAGALRSLAVTVGGGYAFFLLVVLVFHTLIAGQRGAFASAVRAGAFLAFGVAAPTFAASLWWSSRR